MKSARVSFTGALLDQDAMSSRHRLPVSGHIRGGIKELYKAAVDNIPGAQKIYADGVSAGASFDDIERALRKANPKFTRSPLVPKNVPYFRACQADFVTPGAVEAIYKEHGEQRAGDTEPQLYSLPIIFPSDDIDMIFKEQFEAWKASQLFRWSEPDKDGVLQCMKRQEIKPQRGKRHQWGGRNAESCRECDPNSCDIFGAGDCKHIGALYFWMPLVSGVGLIELKFTSVYASLGIMEVLQLVKSGLGRVSGVINGQPIFRLSKVTKDVSRINWETGKVERSRQHIIQLEADGLNMFNILAGEEQARLPAPEDVPQLSSPEAGGVVQDVVVTKEPDHPAEKEPQPIKEARPSPEVSALRSTRARIAKTLGWTAEDLHEWLTGNGYSNVDGFDAQKLAHQIRKLEAVQPSAGHEAEAPPPEEPPVGAIEVQEPPVSGMDAAAPGKEEGDPF